jgi:hypothetical protein
MIAITKFKTHDGVEFDTEEKAAAHEHLCQQVRAAMIPLDIPAPLLKRVRDGEGWYQHDIETVYAVREAILALARPRYAKSYLVFNAHGRTVHPLSSIGRILSDCDRSDPIGKAWSRFASIDATGREHQQCYFAYTAGPSTDHVCLNP